MATLAAAWVCIAFIMTALFVGGLRSLPLWLGVIISFFVVVA